MRLPDKYENTQGYFEHYFGTSLDAILNPIGDNQVGESVRHNGVYFDIKEARLADDPSLPMGVWSHELKVADWRKVRQLALSALCGKSKDLQLAVWLFEANIHLYGFAGIAPAALLIQQLCEQYWDTMHPEMIDGDVEFRTNPMSWLNDKMTPQLKLIKLTQAKFDGKEYSWYDWENSLRKEQIKKQQNIADESDGATPKMFKKRLSGTPDSILLNFFYELHDGSIALKNLQHWFDQKCGNESPNLMDLSALLTKIKEMISVELKRRKLKFGEHDNLENPVNDPKSLSAEQSPDNDDSGDGSNKNQKTGSGGGENGNNFNGEFGGRDDVFICLKKAAEYLKKEEPHSPVPYLIDAACEWGDKDARELYQELFLKLGGQLNIFELMGLEQRSGGEQQ